MFCRSSWLAAWIVAFAPSEWPMSITVSLWPREYLSAVCLTTDRQPFVLWTRAL